MVMKHLDPKNILKNIFGGSFSQAFFVASDLDCTNRARPIYTYTSQIAKQHHGGKKST